jgi:Tfp pilus assembly protein PilX
MTAMTNLNPTQASTAGIDLAVWLIYMVIIAFVCGGASTLRSKRVLLKISAWTLAKARAITFMEEEQKKILRELEVTEACSIGVGRDERVSEKVRDEVRDE